jgi:hypothetical protein
MPLDAGALLADAAADPAYPTLTPAEAQYPCQVRAPLCAPLDGIATPAMWSRLAEPLRRVFEELWAVLGLRDAGRPERWVGLYYGRIALNGHGWERLCSAAQDRPADASLIVPAGGLARIADAWEGWRAHRRASRLAPCFELAEQEREQLLRSLGKLEPSELDTAELARGPLDEARWTHILLPTFRAPLLEETRKEEDRALTAGLVLEQRWSAEIGRRLATRGVLGAAAQVAYLTVPERIRAVHEPGEGWAILAEQRARRVEKLARIGVPDTFWGRPRLTGDAAAAVGYNSTSV